METELQDISRLELMALVTGHPYDEVVQNVINQTDQKLVYDYVEYCLLRERNPRKAESVRKQRFNDLNPIFMGESCCYRYMLFDKNFPREVAVVISSGGDQWYQHSGTNTWKKTPSVESYDFSRQ